MLSVGRGEARTSSLYRRSWILTCILLLTQLGVLSTDGQSTTGNTMTRVDYPPDPYTEGTVRVTGSFTASVGSSLDVTATFSVVDINPTPTPVTIATTALVLSSGAILVRLPIFPTSLTSGGRKQCHFSLVGTESTITFDYRTPTVMSPSVPTMGAATLPTLWSTSSTHSCVKGQALSSGLRCWGSDSNGQLAGSSLTQDTTYTPVTVTGNEVKQVSVGVDVTCAVYISGHALCWGANAQGQAGVTSSGPAHRVAQVSNIPFMAFADRARVSSISVGFNHTCALFETQGVRCFGGNAVGQLGQDHTRSIGTSWSDLATLPYVSLKRGDTAISAIHAGYGRTCAILASDGKLLCWGSSPYGELGQGSTQPLGTGAAGNSISDLDPVDFADGSRITQVDSSSQVTCVVFAAGNVKCIGRNDKGQLGQGVLTLAIGNTPDQIRFLPSIAYGTTHHATMVAVTGDSVCVLFVNNAVRCHGDNSNGILRIPSSSSLSSRPLIGRVAGDMTSLPFIEFDFPGSPCSARVVQVGAGENHYCAVYKPNDGSTGGSISCWGSNINNVLGRATQFPSTFYSDLSLVTAGSTQLAIPLPHAPSEVTCTIIDVFRVRLSWNTQFPSVFASRNTEFEVIELGSLQAIVRTTETSVEVTNRAQVYAVRTLSPQGASVMSTVTCRPRDFQTCTRNFWRASESVSNTFSCLRNDICPSQVLSSCSEGYTGQLCSACAAGYARFRGVCEICPHPVLSWLMAIVAIVGFAAFLSVIISRATSANPLSATTMLMALHFLQFLSLIGELDLQWSAAIGAIFQVAKTLSMGDLASYPTQCAFQATYKARLVVYWLAPIFFYVLPIIYYRRQTQRATKDDQDDDGILLKATTESILEAREHYGSRAAITTGVFLLVFYPVTLFHFLHIWRCPSVDHPSTNSSKRFLLLDSDTECWGSNHTGYWVPTALVLILYNIVIAVGALSSIRMFKFASVQYMTLRPWFDFVLLATKAIIVIILVYLSSEVLWQAYLTIWVVFLLLCAVVMVAPYREKLHQRIALAAIAAITIALQIGLVFLTIIERGYSETSAEPVVFTLAMFALLLALAYFLTLTITRKQLGDDEPPFEVEKRPVPRSQGAGSSDNEDGRQLDTRDQPPSQLPALIAAPGAKGTNEDPKPQSPTASTQSSDRKGSSSGGNSSSSSSSSNSSSSSSSSSDREDSKADTKETTQGTAGAAIIVSSQEPSKATADDILARIFALEDKRLLASRKGKGDTKADADCSVDEINKLWDALHGVDEENDDHQDSEDDQFAKEHSRLVRHLKTALKSNPDMTAAERARLWADYERGLRRLREAQQAAKERQRQALELRLQALRDRSDMVDQAKIEALSNPHSDDPDYDIQAILDEYAAQQRRLQEALDAEAARQALELERQLAARKAMKARHKEAASLISDADHQSQSLSDADREKLYKEYLESLRRIEEAEDSAAARQAEQLARKLEARRSRRSQINEEKIVVIADQSIDDDALRDKILQEYADQQKKLADAIALEEARQQQALERRLKERKHRLKRVEKARSRVEDAKDLSDVERDRLLKAYDDDLERLHAVESAAAERQAAALERKLAERRARAVQIDQSRVEVTQDIDLDEKMRQRILAEYIREQQDLKKVMETEEERQARALNHRLAERKARRSQLLESLERTAKAKGIDSDEKDRIMAEYQESIRRVSDAESATAARQQADFARRLAERQTRKDEIESQKIAVISDQDLTSQQRDRLLREYAEQEKRLAEAIALEEQRQTQFLERRLQDRAAQRAKLEAGRAKVQAAPTKAPPGKSDDGDDGEAQRRRLYEYYENSLRRIDEATEISHARQQNELQRKLDERRARKARVDSEKVAAIQSDSLDDDQRKRILQEYEQQEQELAHAIELEEARQSRDLRRRLEERKALREKMEADKRAKVAAAEAHDEAQSEEMVSKFEEEISMLKNTEEATRRRQEEQLSEKLAYHRARKEKLEKDKVRVLQSTEFDDAQRDQLVQEYERQIEICDQVLAQSEARQQQQLQERIQERKRQREELEAKRIETLAASELNEQQRQRLVEDYNKALKESETAAAQAKARQRTELERTIAERKARRAALEAEKEASMSDPAHLDDASRDKLQAHYQKAIEEIQEDEKEAESAQEDVLREQTDDDKTVKQDLLERKLKVIHSKEIDDERKAALLKAYDERIQESDQAAKLSEQRQKQALERKLAERKARKAKLEEQKRARDQAAAATAAAATEPTSSSSERSDGQATTRVSIPSTTAVSGEDEELQRLAAEVEAAEAEQRVLQQNELSDTRRNALISLYDRIATVVRDLEKAIDSDGALLLRKEHPESQATPVSPRVESSEPAATRSTKTTATDSSGGKSKAKSSTRPTLPPPPAPHKSSPAPRSSGTHNRDRSNHEALEHLPKPQHEPEAVPAPAPAPGQPRPKGATNWSRAVQDIQNMMKQLDQEDLSAKERRAIQRKYEQQLAQVREAEAAAKDRQNQRLQAKINAKKKKKKKGKGSTGTGNDEDEPHLLPPPPQPVDPEVLERRQVLSNSVRKLQKQDRRETMSSDELRQNLGVLEDFAEEQQREYP